MKNDHEQHSKGLAESNLIKEGKEPEVSIMHDKAYVKKKDYDNIQSDYKKLQKKLANIKECVDDEKSNPEYKVWRIKAILSGLT